MSLTGAGEEVTYRRRNDSKTAASPRPTTAWVTAHKAGNLEPTTQSAGSPTGWRMSCPDVSVDESVLWAAGLVSVVFFAAWFVSESSMQFGIALLRRPLSELPLLTLAGGR